MQRVGSSFFPTPSPASYGFVIFFHFNLCRFAIHLLITNNTLRKNNDDNNSAWYDGWYLTYSGQRPDMLRFPADPPIILEWVLVKCLKVI
jgi:hypothetical protein